MIVFPILIGLFLVLGLAGLVLSFIGAIAEFDPWLKTGLVLILGWPLAIALAIAWFFVWLAGVVA